MIRRGKIRREEKRGIAYRSQDIRMERRMKGSKEGSKQASKQGKMEARMEEKKKG